MSRRSRNKNNDVKITDNIDNPLSKKVNEVDITKEFTEKKNEKLSEDLDVISNIMIL